MHDSISDHMGQAPTTAQSDSPDQVLDDLITALEFVMQRRPKTVAILLTQTVQARVRHIQKHAAKRHGGLKR